jgi:hypothetical protein
MVAGLVRVTPYGMHLPRELVQDLVAVGDDMRLAVGCWDRWNAFVGRLAAFETCRSRAKVCSGALVGAIAATRSWQGKYKLDTGDPEHCDVHLQFPPAPHDVLVQHLMSVGSFGQCPTWEVPPPLLHEAVARQTPGVPLTLQGPFTAAFTKEARRRNAARLGRMVFVFQRGVLGEMSNSEGFYSLWYG